MLDGHDEVVHQALKDSPEPKLECFFLVHTDKGRFWIAAKDVTSVDACQLPRVLTRRAASEPAPLRGRLWLVGPTVGLTVFFTTLAGVSYVDPHRDLPERLKGSLKWAVERTLG